MINIIFDQYQRYKNAQIIVNGIRKNNESFKILEVGANEHRNLEKFLPNDDVTYLDISLPENLLNDPKYILGDATDMKFEDNYYDIVIALDVYEHIPKKRRENFIKEIFRVSKNIAIISAPFDKKKVEFAERRANEYYKSLIGVNHLWLHEHIENGLPNREELKKFLETNDINYFKFSHGNLDIWEKLTGIRALLEIDGGLEDYIVQIDRYYNEFIFKSDYDNNGYRNFLVLLKDKERKVVIDTNETNNDKTLDLLIQNVYKLFEIRKSMGILTQKLPLYGHNILRVYFDYGNGYNDLDSVYKLENLYIEKRYLFNGIKDEKVRSIRIDPSEFSGKILLKNIVIKDNNNNIVEGIKITSNSELSNNEEYLFKSKDPQIIINFDETMISSIEFNLKKLDGYEEAEYISNELIQNKIDEMKGELKLEINKSFFSKMKKKVKGQDF